MTQLTIFTNVRMGLQSYLVAKYGCEAENSTAGLLPCCRWCCQRCVREILRPRWTEQIRRVLNDCPVVYIAHIEGSDLVAALQRIKRANGQYVRIRIPTANSIYSNVFFRDSKPLETTNAITCAIHDIFSITSTKRSISTSRLWKLIEPDSAEQ